MIYNGNEITLFTNKLHSITLIVALRLLGQYIWPLNFLKPIVIFDDERMRDGPGALLLRRSQKTLKLFIIILLLVDDVVKVLKEVLISILDLIVVI